MDVVEQKELIEFLHSINPMAEGIFMNPKEMIFEENVKMNCFYCGKYGNNWKCPPNLPDIDYPVMFQEYDEGLFVSYTSEINDKVEYEVIRSESSIMLHKILLQLEKWMWNHDRPTAISFGAGACKLCKNGCGEERCNNPYMSRSPLEATGVNVVKTAKKFGIEVHFPTDDKLMRVGLIVWQNPEREE
ncbi:MAG: DUF2284 domain-containing protein [Lachnospiraceae bacterium]|nr:DUF2284 domain-containing protein [Lachnospiraceae bacterium]